jgi:hypothetical protein
MPGSFLRLARGYDSLESCHAPGGRIAKGLRSYTKSSRDPGPQIATE